MTVWERTQKRDMALSARHRLWGVDCPATDLDLLMVEYDQKIPIALIEYKHKNASEAQCVESANAKAVMVLADRAGLPFLIVRYCNDTWWFRTYPMNDLAKPLCEWAQPFREREFVELLYRIRGRQLPDHICRVLE